MTDQDRLQQGEAAPEAFVRQVKDALDHLHDLAYLQQHHLAYGRGLERVASANAAVHRLRSELVEAIEVLNPGKSVAFHAPHPRIYNLLTLHYVDGLTIREAAGELGVSVRQADRDLRQGEQGVAAVMWANREAAASLVSEAGENKDYPQAHAEGYAEPSSLQAEMARLEVRLRPTDLVDLLRRAQEAVRPQAEQREVRFRTELPYHTAIFSTDPLLAEQVVLNVLSRAVGQACPGNLDLSLLTAGGLPSLVVHFAVNGEATRAPVADPVLGQLAGLLDWTIAQRDWSDGMRSVVIHLAARGPLVLAIDDNQGLVGLIERFLTDQPWRVVAANNGQDGLRLAQELQPAVILLDVMMPDMHGWDVLQRLHAGSQTAGIPVIICSVINNPELALALGARGFLPKPVRREDLLDALARLNGAKL